MPIASPDYSIWGQLSLFEPYHHTKIVPPVRLDVRQVERSLQLACEQQAEETRKKRTFNRTLRPSHTLVDWSSIYAYSTANLSINQNSANDPAKISTKVPLKRVLPFTLFEKTKTRKIMAPPLQDMNLDISQWNIRYEKHVNWLKSPITEVGLDSDAGQLTSDDQLQGQDNSAEENELIEEEEYMTEQVPEEEDLLSELLGEADYNSRGRIIVARAKRKQAKETLISADTADTSKPGAVRPEADQLASKDIVVPALSPAPALSVTDVDSTASTELAQSVTEETSKGTTELVPVASESVGDSITTASRKETTEEVSMDTSGQASPLASPTTEPIIRLPAQIVPVFATGSQLKEIQLEAIQMERYSGSIKHRIGKIIDILNHPMHALVCRGSTEGPDVWGRSGKTLFLRLLTTRLEDRNEATDVAIVCYDLNMEEFLVDLFQNVYPYQRLNTTADSLWSGEYGVIVRIQKKKASVAHMSKEGSKVHLVIVIDPRLQGNTNVARMFEDSDTRVSPPCLSLVTVNSVEQRLLEYMWKQNPPQWQLPDQESCATIFNTTHDIAMPSIIEPTSAVVESLLHWINSGMKTIYQHARPSSAFSLPSPSIMTNVTTATATLEPHIVDAADISQQSSTLDARGRPTVNVAAQPMSAAAATGSSQPPPVSSSDIIPMSVPDSDVAADEDNPDADITNNLQALFSHTSLSRLQSDLVSWRSKIANATKQDLHMTSDEDSFYSAESETPDETYASSQIANVLASTTDNNKATTAHSRRASVLRSLKLEFDRKCLDRLEVLLSTYNESLKDLQAEFISETNKQLKLHSITTTDSTSTDAD